jgi:hypothetical protein
MLLLTAAADCTGLVQTRKLENNMKKKNAGPPRSARTSQSSGCSA